MYNNNHNINYQFNHPQYIENLEQLPDNTINSEQVNEDVLTKYGGITLSILIALSFFIFIILFYDSLCIEEKLNVVTPPVVVKS